MLQLGCSPGSFKTNKQKLGSGLAGASTKKTAHPRPGAAVGVAVFNSSKGGHGGTEPPVAEVSEPWSEVQASFIALFKLSRNVGAVSGVHPKVVQGRLGHSSVALTLDRYSHVVDGMDRDAAELVAKMVAIGLQSGSTS